MATNANLPAGAFITSLGGKRCTAIPKRNGGGNGGNGGDQQQTATSTEATSTEATSTSTEAQATSAPPPPPPPPPPAETTTTAAQETSTTQQQQTTTTAQVQQPPPAAAPIRTTTSAPPPPQETTTQETSTQETTTQETSTSPPTSLVTSNIDSATGGAGVANGVLLTTDGTRVLTLDPAAASDGSLSGTGKGAVNQGASDATSSQTNIAIVAGVLGGLAFVLLVAFIFWFLRRRMRRGRRSTLLTPLGPEQGFGNLEKRPYFISRDSIGPTPLTEKFRATVGVNFKKFRSRFTSIVARSNSPAPSVNLDRGNSQFLDGPIGGVDTRDSEASSKDRFLGFFGRFGGDRGRDGRDQARYSRADPFANTRGMKDSNKKRTGSQPDFLTLLNMDDKQLAAQTRRKSVSGKRRSTSAGSSDHFLGGLELGFDTRDPFSDGNEMTRASAKVAPLGVTKRDPFSDANAIRPPSQSRQAGPSTYVETMRRSRGQSMGGSRPPSAGAAHTRRSSLYRESLASVESFETRRNKCRSDPFDLDRPELLSASVTSSAMDNYPVGRDSRVGPSPPGRAHVRQDSYGSSNYSSAASDEGDYFLGDPGPDVGPAAKRHSPPGAKRKTGGSQGSVGKAL